MPQLRIDRFATLYLFRPLLKMVQYSTGGSIPILMYHSISDTPESRHAYYQTCTTPEIFGEQLKVLRQLGYTTISLASAVNKLKRAGSDERQVVITFDDGYEDFYSNAFPLLDKYGYSATVFLPTAYIHHTSRYFCDRECLTWNQVRQLQRAGIQFGSHTVNHPQLRNLKTDEVEREVVTSKQKIEDQLGRPVTSFSYPYAFPETSKRFKRTLRRILQEAGYEDGVSTIVGTASQGSDPLFLERLPVNSSDDKDLFAAKLDGAYDWVHAVQFAHKRWQGMRYPASA